MNSGEFERLLAEIRPRLHRYCARMTGSSLDGEDVLQEALIKATRARSEGAIVESPEAWLFRIAHNSSLDFLRGKSRAKMVPLTEYQEAPLEPTPDIVAISFQAFLRLPELQRCAVILKDVLGHSIDEIAAIAGCTTAAAKSALQRGRVALQQHARLPDDARLPMLSDADRSRIAACVSLFQAGDFHAIRAMLVEDVKLELVNRLRWEGREKIAPYFTRYAEVAKWRFVLGAVEGRPAMLVFDSTGNMARPTHFVLIDWADERIAGIRDFLFAPYVLEAAVWVRLT